MNVTLQDIGPIQSLDIPIERGTVTVLTGPNGSGKTTAVRAVVTAAET